MSDHLPRPVERHCDVAVVGGSAAGLAAALQLVRQRRSVIVVDAGDPRNAPADHMHGYLGHEGVPPAELTAIGRDEVRSYGGEVVPGRAVDVWRTEDGRFRVALVGGHSIVARRVLAATGLVDELPDIDGLARHWGRDVIHCAFCHGYEVRDRRIVQIVTHPMGLHPTTLLRQLSARLTVVIHDDVDVEGGELKRLRAGGIEVARGVVRRVIDGAAGVAGVELVDGRRLDADTVVVGPRFRGDDQLRPRPRGSRRCVSPLGERDRLGPSLRGRADVERQTERLARGGGRRPPARTRAGRRGRRGW